MKKLIYILFLLPFVSQGQTYTLTSLSYYGAGTDTLYSSSANDSLYRISWPTGMYIGFVKQKALRYFPISKISGLQAALDAKGTSNFDGAYNSLTSKPDLTVYLSKTDSGRLVGNYATGGDLNKVRDSVQANVALKANAASPVFTGSFTAAAGSIVNAALANGAVANLSGTNTGDQTITLTGDVTGSGTGSFATTIGATKVTNAMLAGSIAYSKLSLTGAVLNADLAGSIAYSKLSLTGAILNADLAGSIAESKLGLTDITTANASTSAHGFMPKADNNAVHFYRSDGTQATPTGVNSTITFLGSDVTNNNASANTIADVTALSFAVTSGVTYRFKFFIVYTGAATTTGSRWAINGPTTTFLNYTSRYTITATSETVNYISAYDSPAAANASSLSTGNIAIIEGIIKPSANGTVIARFASEISASAIVAKGGQSYVEFQAIN